MFSSGISILELAVQHRLNNVVEYLLKADGGMVDMIIRRAERSDLSLLHMFLRLGGRSNEWSEHYENYGQTLLMLAVQGNSSKHDDLICICIECPSRILSIFQRARPKLFESLPNVMTFPLIGSTVVQLVMVPLRL